MSSDGFPPGNRCNPSSRLDILAIVGLDNGKLLVLSLARGLPLKTVAAPRGRTEIERLIDIDSEPKAFGDTLYLAAYRGNVAAINMRDGNLVWSRDLSSHAGLDVDARQVYVSDDADAVLALDGKFTGLDSRSGEQRWAPIISRQRGLDPRRHRTGGAVPYKCRFFS